jgi:hypothetical protein
MPIVRMALLTKNFPDDYSNDVKDILKIMSFSDNVIIVGSASLRTQFYAGDYDGFEKVEVRSLSNTVSKFQSIISHLKKHKNVYVGDIKAGEIPQWNVLEGAEFKDGQVVGWVASEFLARLEALKKAGVITNAEYAEAKPFIKATPTPETYFIAKDEIKFHVVRWTVNDVMDGHTTLRDGRTFTLSEAFTTPSLAKVDVVSRVAGSRFTEFSMVYEFVKDGKVLNPTDINISKSLLESIIAYSLSGNYFKVLKRTFSLARYEKNKELIAKLEPILNSDLGRLYLIINDIEVLMFMLDRYKNLPGDEIRFEIDQFINRLSNITLPPLIGKQPTLNKAIRHIETLSLPKMVGPLETLKNTLYKLLQHYAKPIADAIAPVALSGAGGESPAQWGPRLWRFLHIVASRHNITELREAFKIVIRRMTCPACRIHTSDYLMEHPITEPTDRYVWEFHNEVNRRTGKEQFPLAGLSRYKNAEKGISKALN